MEARANGRDVTALPQLWERLDRHSEVWQNVGDLKRLVVRCWADLLTDDNPLALDTEEAPKAASAVRTRPGASQPACEAMGHCFFVLSG